MTSPMYDSNGKKWIHSAICLVNNEPTVRASDMLRSDHSKLSVERRRSSFPIIIIQKSKLRKMMEIAPPWTSTALIANLQHLRSWSERSNPSVIGTKVHNGTPRHRSNEWSLQKNHQNHSTILRFRDSVSLSSVNLNSSHGVKKKKRSVRWIWYQPNVNYRDFQCRSKSKDIADFYNDNRALLPLALS
jgi:hypothetical protein